MNRSRCIFVAAIAFAACLPAWADESAATKPTLPAGYVIRTPGLGSPATYTFEELLKAAELTPEQQVKFAKIEQLRAEQHKEKEKALREAQENLKAHPGPEASQKFNQANMALYETQTKAQDEMQALLTQQQKAKWQEYIVLRAFKGAFHDVDLDDKQWEQIMAAYEKLAKETALSPYRVLNRLIVQAGELLTPQQRAKRTLAKYDAMAKVCSLTDEQVQKIGGIEQERLREVTKFEEQCQKELDRLHKVCRDARASGDLVAFEAAQSQIGALFKPGKELDKKYDDKVQAVLTDKQRTDWQQRLR